MTIIGIRSFGSLPEFVGVNDTDIQLDLAAAVISERGFLCTSSESIKE